MAVVAAVGVAAPVAADGAIVFQHTTGPQTRMFIAGNDGTGAHRLPVSGGNPIISPDGMRVAYQSASTIPRLRILTLASGAVVTPAGTCQAQVVWSPDSTRLLCQTQTVDRHDYITGNGLASVDAATGVVTTLVPARGTSVDTFGWSPDGTRVAYSRGRFGASTSDVYVADPAIPGSARRLVRNATAPVWGPRRIAVTRYRQHRAVIGGDAPVTVSHSQIWTVNPGGGGAHQLTHYRSGSYLIYGPSTDLWTPDGSRIVATVAGTDYGRLITVNAATGRTRGLQRGGELIVDPVAISPDGRSLLVTEGIAGIHPRLRVMGIGGRPGRILLRDAGAASATADWAP